MDRFLIPLDSMFPLTHTYVSESENLRCMDEFRHPPSSGHLIILHQLT